MLYIAIRDSSFSSYLLFANDSLHLPASYVLIILHSLLFTSRFRRQTRLLNLKCKKASNGTKDYAKGVTNRKFIFWTNLFALYTGGTCMALTSWAWPTFPPPQIKYWWWIRLFVGSLLPTVNVSFPRVWTDIGFNLIY